jgi:hypothetical protein
MAPMSRNITNAPEKGVFPLDHFAECQKASSQGRDLHLHHL